MSKITNDGLTQSGTGCFLYSCTHMATVGVKGLTDTSFKPGYLVMGRKWFVVRLGPSNHRSRHTGRHAGDSHRRAFGHCHHLLVNGNCRPLLCIQTHDTQVSSSRNGTLFSNLVVNAWNSLPDVVSLPPTVSSFQHKLQ